MKRKETDRSLNTPNQEYVCSLFTTVVIMSYKKDFITKLSLQERERLDINDAHVLPY